VIGMRDDKLRAALERVRKVLPLYGNGVDAARNIIDAVLQEDDDDIARCKAITDDHSAESIWDRG
jgi:hypothetical protein